MRRARTLLLFAFALALIAGLATAGFLHHRYALDFGSAIAKALRPTQRFTVDPQTLREFRFARVLWLGFVEDPRANEISGLAASRRRDDLLFAINDSGDGPFLYAMGTDGKNRGRIRVLGAQNVDWEALAAFELDGAPYLLIGDVGDNLAWRPAITLYVVPEPELHGERFPADARVSPAFVLRARLEGGPEDCEAVGVDAHARRVLLLTKRAVPPVLFALDLEPRRDDPRATKDVAVARRLTTVPGIPQPTDADLAADPRYGRVSSQPTALDVSPDGTRAVVFTYKEAYLFERRTGEAWARAFARMPLRVPLPRVTALEAGAFARDGRTLYMSSEYLPAPLYRLEP
jgi:hypothetical protein